MLRYRNLEINAPDYEPLSYYSSDTDQDLAAWLANIGNSGTASTGVEGNGGYEAGYSTDYPAGYDAGPEPDVAVAAVEVAPTEVAVADEDAYFGAGNPEDAAG